MEVSPPSAQCWTWWPVRWTGWSFLRKLPTSRAELETRCRSVGLGRGSLFPGSGGRGRRWPSLRRRPHPGLASDVEYLGFGAYEDAGEGAVTGDHPQHVDIDDGAVFGFVDATGVTLEGWWVGVKADVGFLATGL